MKFIKEIKFYLVLSLLFSIWISISFQRSLDREKKLMDDLKLVVRQKDSISEYLFVYDIEYNRYLIAHDMLYQINPKASNELDSLLTNETE
jgi:hypothetical protein